MPRVVDWADPKQAKKALRHSAGMGSATRAENWKAGDLMGRGRIAQAVQRAQEWEQRLQAAKDKHRAGRTEASRG
jgi:hypothetical protein